jgi:hypothetical protein
MLTNFLLENLKGRDHAEDLGIDGKIILEWILERRGKMCGLNASGSRWAPVGGSCEYSNEPLGSIKGGKFLDNLSDS